MQMIGIRGPAIAGLIALAAVGISGMSARADTLAAIKEKGVLSGKRIERSERGAWRL